jgi:glycosyltransferase involved in cell wall biosynthesis
VKNLRILHVIEHIYPTLGYQETYMAREHSCLNNTLVITSERYARLIFDANEKLLKKRRLAPGLYVEEGIKILRLPVRFDIELIDNLWLVGLEQAVIKFKPDVIIIHGIVNLSSIRIAILKSKLRNAKIIFDEHMTYDGTRGGWTKLFYRIFRLIFVPTILKSANALVAVTNDTKRFMHEEYGIPSSKIVTIPLGVDLNNFYRDLNARYPVRKRFGINDEAVVFIYAGKVVAQKGVHLLVEAASKIGEIRNNVRFLIVGGSDPVYLARLKKRMFELNVQDCFIFVDAVPNNELRLYYNASDAGIWPLQCSLTMIEAMACGLPIIISDKSGATERITSGSGFLYKETDCTDLSRKIILLLNDELRKEMSKKALDYAKNLSWTTISERFLTLLDRNDST